MANNNLIKKGLALVIIVLFFGMSAMPSAGNSETEKYASVKDNLSDFIKSLNSDPFVIPIIFGQMGENGWYISEVSVSFQYDPERVKEIYYRIHEGEDWILYSETFWLREDEKYHIGLYWIDYEDKRHDEPLIDIKIDQTAPTISLTKYEFLFNKNKLRFEADVSDATSGVERVEFYLDDEPQFVDEEAPYEWEYVKAEGDEEEHFVYAIVYDYAGHSEESETLSTPLTSFYNTMILSKFLQRMQNTIMWNQKNAINLIFHLLSLFRFH